ncbi:MAG: hypothetical protein ACOVOR_01220 [Rhabdochlamydiaceae bacterium]
MAAIEVIKNHIVYVKNQYLEPTIQIVAYTAALVFSLISVATIFIMPFYPLTIFTKKIAVLTGLSICFYLGTLIFRVYYRENKLTILAYQVQQASFYIFCVSSFVFYTASIYHHRHLIPLNVKKAYAISLAIILTFSLAKYGQEIIDEIKED